MIPKGRCKSGTRRTEGLAAIGSRVRTGTLPLNVEDVMIYTDPDTNQPFIGWPISFTGPGGISLIGDYYAPSSLTHAIHCAPAAEGTPRAAPKQRRIVRSLPDARAWLRHRAPGAGRPALGPYRACASCATGLVRPSQADQGMTRCEGCRKLRSRGARLGE